MSSEINQSWGKKIRWYVYKMLILLGFFVLIALGYHSWYMKSSDSVRIIANEYHLTSTFHYLKAMEELRSMQVYSAIEPTEQSVDSDLTGKTRTENGYDKYRTSMYVIRQEIRNGLKLHQTFDDSRFASLTSRLERQLSDYMGNVTIADLRLDQLVGLLTSLNQLVRLHAVIREQRLAEIKVIDNRQKIIFYLLLLVLTSAGLLITRQGLLAINMIINKYQDAENTIRHQAHFDSLTNLPNRFLSLDRLNQMILEAQRDMEMVAVLFLDLDDFKKINDLLGHDTGDKLLIEVAGRLSSAVRNRDTVGRLGGDEFVLILGGVKDRANILGIAENIIKSIRKAFKIDGRELILTTSVGISIYPVDGSSSSDLLRNADSAMYYSKKSGRNTYSFFTESMNHETVRRLELEEKMHGALDRGELEVLFQPKVDLSIGKIVGAEALLRWKNDELGNVSPVEFIPVAEQTGLIVQIGQFVLDEAIGFTSRVHEQLMPEFHIAVNISPRQFRDPQLVSHLINKVKQYDIAYHDLELEITEGVLMSGHDYIHKALGELSTLGIGIAMDDFGTGYSSLNYLRQYPFNIVKIDRSFISDLVSNSADRELISASITMAHGLNLKVVAEGVETDEQFAFLKNLDCDYAQGYLFGKPVEADVFIQLLESEIIPRQRAELS